MEIAVSKLLDDLVVIPQPEYMICSPVQFAVLKAHMDFQGRNWRRIKREVNKAAKKAKRAKVP